ncbi:23S rRNA pseudouridine(2604) synthase RluF [Flocculibacter collagenilyticus]|uniref:23S rRNA pseudouridine(2604) synthase RluF n=1 Tax=Flocculibacter collagenilyticus TaxID=2744479 RepID=UPI0018F694D8|nr:23S rRNA pseudouridine(2604) synthase RluF [Flocculibacter collagenilyticus]
MSDLQSTGKRLNKFISESGFCSRREADKLIDAGRVTINGTIPELGTKVMPDDQVEVDGKAINQKQKLIYIALNKPVGVTCTTERHVRGNIVDFIGHKQRIFPIGRLDKPSQGLIFLTSDGDIVNKILRAGNAHEKEYIVTVNKPITSEFVRRMSSGVPILDTVTQPCKVEKIDKFTFKIILTQGLNRQIRRMTEYLGFDVKTLTRTRIMNISLKGLADGQWRYLTEQEMATLNQAVEKSSKTEEASHLAVPQTMSKSSNPRRPAKNKSHAHQQRENTQSHANKKREHAEQKNTRSTYKKSPSNKQAPANGNNSSKPKRSTKGTLSLGKQK